MFAVKISLALVATRVAIINVHGIELKHFDVRKS